MQAPSPLPLGSPRNGPKAEFRFTAVSPYPGLTRKQTFRSVRHAKAEASIRRSFRDDLPPGGRRPSQDSPGKESGFGPKASRFSSSGLPPPSNFAAGLSCERPSLRPGRRRSISLRFPSGASSGHEMNLHAPADSRKRILPVDNGDIGGGLAGPGDRAGLAAGPRRAAPARAACAIYRASIRPCRLGSRPPAAYVGRAFDP
jgi:hypothetical protein